MKRLFLSWFLSVFLNAIALIAVSQMFTSFYIKNFETALIASIILSILNFILRPLFVILTLPITVVTFGLFLLVINASILMLVANIIGDAFIIDGFFIAIIASILVSLINYILQKLVGDVFEK